MRWALTLILPALLFGQNWLSELKERQIELQKKEAIVEAKKLHDSWINPVRISYLYQRGDQFPNQELKNFTISIDQPIFKSGGIWAAIKYANAKKIASLYGVKANKNSLIALVIKLAYELRQADLRIRKQRLLIENAKIDVKTKEDAYLSGVLDSTFLDQALLQKNAKELALLELLDQKVALEKNIRDLTDAMPKKLPRFSIVTKKDFLSKNLALKRAGEEVVSSKYYKIMSWSRYLPSLSLRASYAYQSMQGSMYVPSYSYQDHYMTYGFSINFPFLDINAPKEIQKAKIEYLKASVDLQQKQKEQKNFYAKSLKDLRTLKKRVELAKEDARVYERLLKTTKDLARAGEKTRYDVMTMQNSLQIRILDQKIYDIQKQLILLELYKEIEGAF